MSMGFDRSAEDIGNIVHLEHVNLAVPDQLAATRFYISALGLTRDPYLNTGAELMWVNAGATQFHLVQGSPQRLRGRIDLVMPDRGALIERLQRHGVAFEEHAAHVDLRCPWGNRLRCIEPDAGRFGSTTLGIVQIAFDVPNGSAEGIARFYREVFGARATASDGTARVPVGLGQTLLFTETAAELPPYDGHHVQVYVADFSGPHRRLLELGLVTEESNRHQYRFVDIVDPRTGTPCLRIEHEVRAMTHPMFKRPLVNRNPLQATRGYQPGCDSYWG